MGSITEMRAQNIETPSGPAGPRGQKHGVFPGETGRARRQDPSQHPTRSRALEARSSPSTRHLPGARAGHGSVGGPSCSGAMARQGRAVGSWSQALRWPLWSRGWWPWGCCGASAGPWQGQMELVVPLGTWHKNWGKNFDNSVERLSILLWWQLKWIIHFFQVNSSMEQNCSCAHKHFILAVVLFCYSGKWRLLY